MYVYYYIMRNVILDLPPGDDRLRSGDSSVSCATRHVPPGVQSNVSQHNFLVCVIHHDSSTRIINTIKLNNNSNC